MTVTNTSVTSSSAITGISGVRSDLALPLGADTNIGVMGDSEDIGVIGIGKNGYGVWGVSKVGNGVYGASTEGTGVFGSSSSGYGVYGESSEKVGVYGESSSGIGVYGKSVSSAGVDGISQSGNGVVGQSATGNAAYFQGGAGGAGACTYNGGADWSCTSDRNAKENFQAVNSVSILEAVAKLPITTWSMKGDAKQTPHMGPVAQDFYAAFGLGENDITINRADAQGVTLAAVQGLYELVQQQSDLLATQEQRIAELEARLSGQE